MITSDDLYIMFNNYISKCLDLTNNTARLTLDVEDSWERLCQMVHIMNSFPTQPEGEQDLLCTALCDILLSCATFAVLNKQVNRTEYLILFCFVPFHCVLFCCIWVRFHF